MLGDEVTLRVSSRAIACFATARTVQTTKQANTSKVEPHGLHLSVEDSLAASRFGARFLHKEAETCQSHFNLASSSLRPISPLPLWRPRTCAVDLSTTPQLQTRDPNARGDEQQLAQLQACYLKFRNRSLLHLAAHHLFSLV